MLKVQWQLVAPSGIQVYCNDSLSVTASVGTSPHVADVMSGQNQETWRPWFVGTSLGQYTYPLLRKENTQFCLLVIELMIR